MGEKSSYLVDSECVVFSKKVCNSTTWTWPELWNQSSYFWTLPGL